MEFTPLSESLACESDCLLLICWRPTAWAQRNVSLLRHGQLWRWHDALSGEGDSSLGLRVLTGASRCIVPFGHLFHVLILQRVLALVPMAA